MLAGAIAATAAVATLHVQIKKYEVPTALQVSSAISADSLRDLSG